MFPSIKLPTKVIPQKRKRKAASEKSKKDLLEIVKLQRCCETLIFWSVYRIENYPAKSYIEVFNVILNVKLYDNLRNKKIFFYTYCVLFIYLNMGLFQVDHIYNHA